MKILFVQLLNNYSGSPKVLSTVIRQLSLKTGMKISLLTSKTDGFLSNLENVRHYSNRYFWTDNRLLLAIVFVWAQINMFFFVLFHKYDVIYINTSLPFAAAVAAKLKKTKVIYHVHEIYIQPNAVKRLYYLIMNKCADIIICVSYYVKENLPFATERSTVIYNPIIQSEFIKSKNNYIRKKFDNRIIFMPTSLKEYKGVNQFVELAKQNPDYKFLLLCSTTKEKIEIYFSQTKLPKNLILMGKRKKLDELYQESAIVMNLSLPDKCVETFGLTLIEGFETYTPAIAPNFGGPREIINNGVNGFLINPYDLNEVSNAIHSIMASLETYYRFSEEAKNSSSKYDVERFMAKILNVIK